MHVPPIFNSLGMLLLVACLIAMLSRRIGLPYSAGLVAAGVVIALFPNTPQLPLSTRLIFDIFLPPLVFEAALQLEWKSFRRELPVTLLLSFVGVALAATAVGVGMHLFLGWTWVGAGLFGILIAATDPVAVIAAFKEMKAEKRLGMIVESESLLNDGISAVAFVLLASVANGAALTIGGIATGLLWSVLGALLIGGLVSGAMLLLAGRTNDHLVEITLTAIAAYGSFLIAESLGASGVLASLTAGLIVGNIGWKGAISDEGREHVLSAWEFFAFLANSCVFILIGSNEASQPIGLLGFVPAGLAILLVLVGRAVAVYPLSALFNGTALKLPQSYRHVLFWGGLRGALALALALAVPESVPERSAIIITTFVVVAFSIFLQGLTMPWLIRRFGLIRDQGTADRGAEAAAA